jgi:fatty-acyl-CoA synthase
MDGLMQDYPLGIQHILWRAERLFAKKHVVTKRENGLHRYSYVDMARRVRQRANVLTKLGVNPGDRVGTLPWNNYRHLELFYAVASIDEVPKTSVGKFDKKVLRRHAEPIDETVSADAKLSGRP